MGPIFTKAMVPGARTASAGRYEPKACTRGTSTNMLKMEPAAITAV